MGDYGNSQNYTMTICPSTPGQAIQAAFTSFNTEANSDYLYIYDGTSTSAPLIGMYSGTTLPGTIIANGANTTGCLTFRFTSDGGTVRSGWVASISCVAPPPPAISMNTGTISICSTLFYDPGGLTNNYANSQNYTMTFCPSTPGQVIQVTFTSFDLEADFDYLYVYDGNSTSSPLLGQFSGSPSLGTIKATTLNSSGCLTFRFVSDGGTVGAGWVANISCTPIPDPPIYLVSTGGTINTCSGTFYDPGGVNGNYTKNHDQTITFCPSTPGQVIQVSFSSFSTQSGNDYLYVYDGNSTGATQIGNYSGTTSPGVINVTGSNSSGCLTFRFVSSSSTHSSGWVATISCVAPPPPIINMTNGSYTVCAATFFDNGGSGSNYSSGQNTTMIICPSTPGQCIRTAFSSFDLEDNFDYLSVFNGNSTSAPMILGSSYTAASPGTITATTTNTTGCLTFKFYSDGATTASGWAASISCAACTTPPPNGVQQDCNGAETICNNQNVTGTSLGPGVYNDLNLGLGNLGCLNNYAATPNGSAEHQSHWYLFSPSASGTIGMTIAPSSSTTDYDWAIFGPYTTIPCPPSGPPLRCSAASSNNSTNAVTGLGNGATDTEEGTGGNGWVSTINVTVGQKYILFLDNWNATSAPYTLSWQLTNGAQLGCSLLPIELLSFTGSNKVNYNSIKWITASEKNNDYFTLERSIDAINWTQISTTKSVGNSTKNNYYGYDDYTYINNSINYYRLKQTNFDGSFEYSPTITIEPTIRETVSIGALYPNPTSQTIHFDCFASLHSILLIEVFDFTGKLVKTENVVTPTGKNDISINISHFTNGIYFIKVSSEHSEKNVIQKIVKN